MGYAQHPPPAGHHLVAFSILLRPLEQNGILFYTASPSNVIVRQVWYIYSGMVLLNLSCRLIISILLCFMGMLYCWLVEMECCTSWFHQVLTCMMDLFIHCHS